MVVLEHASIVVKKATCQENVPIHKVKRVEDEAEEEAVVEALLNSLATRDKTSQWMIKQLATEQQIMMLVKVGVPQVEVPKIGMQLLLSQLERQKMPGVPLETKKPNQEQLQQIWQTLGQQQLIMK